MPGPAGGEKRFSMSRKNRHRITRKLATIGLTMAVSMSLLSASAGSIYASSVDTEDPETIFVNLDTDEGMLIAEGDTAENITVELPENAGVTFDNEGSGFSGEYSSIETEPEGWEAEDIPEGDLLYVVEDELTEKEADGIDVEPDNVNDVSDEDASIDAFARTDDSGQGEGDMEHIDVPAEAIKMGELAAVPAAGTEDSELIEAADESELLSAAAVDSRYYRVAVNQSGNIVTVTGTVDSPYYFYGLYVDQSLVSPVTSQSVNCTIDMNNYDTGYHTVWMALRQGSSSTQVIDSIGTQYVISNKIPVPEYNGVFDVYSTYFDYYPYDMTGGNASMDLYMEYSADGGASWSRTGYMRRNLIKLFIQQAYTISGLRANTTYLTRICYGTYVTYSANEFGDGNSYFFAGPARNTTTIKTGSDKKPAIKSVSLKAVKIKYHKLRWPGYYNVVGGSVFWHSSYIERFWTCKIKVTVKLKKKPGTKGLWISLLGQRKWLNGNKKKYTATFVPTYNYFAKHPKRGKYKFTVSVYSGQDKNWGGYSPVNNKKKRLS